jgi:serine/threonine protein kinase
MEILNDRYQIQQQLGKKSGRQTFLALDLQTQTQVVVKILSFGADFEWDDLKLFEREAATLRSLDHPAIPKYLDDFELSDHGFALVQTYIDAPSLDQQLKTGRTFSPEEVTQLAKSLLEILAYLHDWQPPVIHRDLKPSNILLTNRSGNSPGQIYLVDFGSVQTLAAREGGTMTVVGTYGYMPPEQFGGRATPASDLYSLGATLIYLMSGMHPADLPQEDLRIEFEEFVPQLSSKFGQWLKQLTEPSLKRRFTSVSAALQALENPRSQNAPAVVNMRKPAHSRIQLERDEKTFEVVLPPIGVKAIANPFALIVMTFDATCLLLLLAVGFEGFYLLSALIVTFPFWVFVGYSTYKLLVRLFRSRRIQIDDDQITVTSEIFGLRFQKYPTFYHPYQENNRVARASHTLFATYTPDINRIVYIPGHFARNKKGGQVEIPPQIRIAARNWAYEITPIDIGIRSESEMEWLAIELSRWLGVPIDRT